MAIVGDLGERLRRLRLVVFDFDGVFTDNTVWIDEDGRESVRCCRSDGIGLSRLRAAGVEAMVLSTEPNPVVAARCTKLRLPCEQGCDDKLAKLEEIAEKRGLDFDEIAFVGNDVNDLACLHAVGVPVVVQDAHPEVRDVGLYRTETPGGHGAVREFCDLVVGNR